METYPLFISYSNRDQVFARKFSDDLKTNKIRPWIALDDVRSGNWDEKVEQALDLCSVFVVILSNNSIESENVKDEIYRALNKKKEIIPIIISECELPIGLTRKHHYNFISDYDESLKKLVEELSPLNRDYKPPSKPLFNLTWSFSLSISFVLIIFLSTLIFTKYDLKSVLNRHGLSQKAEKAKLDSTAVANNKGEDSLGSPKKPIKKPVGAPTSGHKRLAHHQKQSIDSTTSFNAGDQVSDASQLKAENLKIYAVNSKGRERESASLKAKGVDKLKLAFILLENPPTSEAPKDIYIRIIDPEGRVLSGNTTGYGAFEFGKLPSKYTVHKSVSYQNNNQTVEILFDNGSYFRPGTYSVELFSEGYKIGSDNFVIK